MSEPVDAAQTRAWDQLAEFRVLLDLTAERLHSLAIVTGPPNGLVATVHDRMPIVLDPDDWDTWLDEGARLAELRPLLRPYPAAELLLYPVSPAVNNVRSGGAELLLPLTRWGDAAAR